MEIVLQKFSKEIGFTGRIFKVAGSSLNLTNFQFITKLRKPCTCAREHFSKQNENAL